MAYSSLDDLVDGITNAMIGAREILEKQHIKTLDRFFEKDDQNRLTAITTKVMIPTPDPDDGDAQMEIDVPLFSIVPMNSLRVENLDIEFDANLSEVTGGKGENKQLKMDVVGGGALGKKSKNCKVKVTITKDDPPEGLVRINNHIIKVIP